MAHKWSKILFLNITAPSGHESSPPATSYSGYKPQALHVAFKFEDESAILFQISAKGIIAVTVVPFPFEWISTRPPKYRTRSCIPRNPTPAVSPGGDLRL